MSDRRWSVLIAAIDEVLKEPLTRLLREEYECEVEIVQQRQELMQKLRGARYYHVVLVDASLLLDGGGADRVSGDDLIVEMKSECPATEIVVSTGGDPVLGKAVLQKGAICCAQIPIDLDCLALQVSQAARFQRRASEKDLWEKLVGINSSLHGEKNERELLDRILEGVHSLGFDRVRLYLLSEDRTFLEAVAGLGMDADFEQRRRPLDECYYMNQLLKAGRSLVFRRRDNDNLPFEDMVAKPDDVERADIPMFLDGEIIGKLSVDNKYNSRSIFEEDLRPLEICAAHAARAIRNRRAADRVGQRVKVLESLREAALEVMEQADRKALLDTITHRAMSLVGAKGCGVYAVRFARDGSLDKLIIIKDYTRPELEGMELEVGEGVAGRLVNSDKPYLIVDDYDKWEGMVPELAGVFGTVLEVPLKWKSRPIGVLYVDRPVGRSFTPEEGELLSLFAQHTASAFVHIERNDNLERLLSSSPVGIIAADGKGEVDRVNDAALSMLKRSKQEVMGTYVGQLFQNKGEERKIGRLLHENGGKFPNYRTGIKASDGTAIPILHSSTWRYDSTGNRAGSIGFFEDMRPLQLIVEASSIVARASNPTLGLRELACRMASLLPQTFCRILLVDSAKQKLTVEAAQFPQTDPQSETHSDAALQRPIVIAEWDGLSKVLKGNDHVLIRSGESEVSHFLKHYSEHLGLDELVRSLLVVPLKVGNDAVGLFEFGQLRSDQPFTEQQIQFAISIAANMAALIRRIQTQKAIERRNKELTRENRSIRMMSGGDSVKATLETIVSQARRVFDCISATIWTYDALGERFIPRELVSDGVPLHILNRFRKTEPSQKGITNAIRKEGWIDIPDVLNSPSKHLTRYMRELLAEADIMSFHGVHLRVGGETVGVLYVSYSTVREFNKEDRQSLERFGAYAALSLKNARSSEQLGKARVAAQAVARVIELGDLNETLKSVCREMVRLTECDVTVLYAYEEDKDKLGSPPTYHGRVRYPEGMHQLAEVPPDSPIRKFLGKKKTTVIEDTLERSSPLKGSRFRRDEKILSCIVVPLRVAGRKVGVMFVNYRSRRRFTSDEIASIELICRQAAIAVSNAQHYDRVNRYLEGQDELLKLSGSLLYQFSLKDNLRDVVKSARLALKANFSNIVLLDDEGTPEFRAGEGWPPEMGGPIPGDSNASQAGFTIKERKPVHVYSYSHEERFVVPKVVKDRGISSGLSVPMFYGEEVIGALLVHSKLHRRFSKREEQLLQLMANHTAIALRNAEQYDQLRHIKGLVGTRTVQGWMRDIWDAWWHEIRKHVFWAEGHISDLKSLVGPEGKLKLKRLSEELKSINPDNRMRHFVDDRVEAIPIWHFISEQANNFQLKYSDVSFVPPDSLDGEITIRASQSKVLFILENLVENAVQAMERVGTASRVIRFNLDVLPDQNRLRISISDSGPGIPKDIQHAINMERRIVKTDEEVGSGMALMLVRAFLTDYDGKIRLERTGPEGTEFVITLPYQILESGR